MATELGASAGTIATYTDDLNCYHAWLDENSLGLDEVGLEQISDCTQHIVAYRELGFKPMRAVALLLLDEAPLTKHHCF